jgi:rSAM-associated Gly-rich repeat protein
MKMTTKAGLVGFLLALSGLDVPPAEAAADRSAQAPADLSVDSRLSRIAEAIKQRESRIQTADNSGDGPITIAATFLNSAPSFRNHVSGWRNNFSYWANTGSFRNSGVHFLNNAPSFRNATAGWLNRISGWVNGGGFRNGGGFANGGGFRNGGGFYNR